MATAESIRKNITSGAFQLKNIRNEEGRRFKSNVWNFMCTIYDDKDALIETHVCCRLCKNVLKYSLDWKINLGSTSNLAKHLKTCLERSSPGPIRETHKSEYE